MPSLLSSLVFPPRDNPISSQERNMIQSMLGRSGKKIRFWSEPATPNNIRDRLFSGCQILHFTGNGNEDSLNIESDMYCGMAESLEVQFSHHLFAANATRPLPSSRENILSICDTTWRMPHLSLLNRFYLMRNWLPQTF